MTGLVGALALSLLLGVVGLGAAGLLTIATFTSVPDLIRRPLSTLPTEPIDMDLAPQRRPAGRHRRARRRVAHAGLDLRASLRAAADA